MQESSNSGTISDAQRGQAVLEYVEDGSYPDEESVVIAELRDTAMLLKLFDRARHEAKAEIKDLSRQQAGDIEGWIIQAKRLKHDIDKSKIMAQEIIREAEDRRSKQLLLQDTASKVNLLEAELVFNKGLGEALTGIACVKEVSKAAVAAAALDNYPEAVDRLQQAEADLAALRARTHTSATLLLAKTLAELSRTTEETLREHWRAMIIVYATESRITMKDTIQGAHIVSLESIATAMEKLGILDASIDKLWQDLDQVILSPILDSPRGTERAKLSINEDALGLSSLRDHYSTDQLIKDLHSIIDYLCKRLPFRVAIPLSQILMPSLTIRLTEKWLNPAVPASLEGIEDFHNILDQVKGFAAVVEALQWKGTGKLHDWVKDAPRVWLNRRREKSLNMVRSILANGINTMKIVERIETEQVGRDEEVLFVAKGDDDWDAHWADDETKPDRQHSDAVPGLVQHQEDNRDASKTDAEDSHEPAAKGLDEDDDVGDAWGWGEEAQADGERQNENESIEKSASSDATPTQRRALSGVTNQVHQEAPARDREITLRETYTVTSIPDALTTLLISIVVDANRLSAGSPSDDDASNPFLCILPAANGLYTLPTQVLAMYRASTPDYYTSTVHLSAPMLLYNDTLYLASTLLDLAKSPAFSHIPTARQTSSADSTSLLQLGRHAYSKEISSHRLILSDILDNAQGLVNCTLPPNSTACETAISSAVSWLQDLHKRWQPLLSRSVLLQTLGTLLGHAVNKLLLDIEDLPDISEAESNRLVTLCTRFLDLDALFLPAPSSPPPPRPDQRQTHVHVHDQDLPPPLPMTAVYTPGWIRFQYLINMLDGSLADIRYLWSEGELRLELTADEVVDLIQALFADSEHRRRTIAEIKRGG